MQGIDLSVHDVHLHLNAGPTRVFQIREKLTRITQPCVRLLCMDGLKRDLIALPVFSLNRTNCRDELTVADGCSVCKVHFVRHT